MLDSANPFFAEVARGAEERAAAEGMSVLLGNSDQNPEREAAYLDLFREQRVNGVLLTPTDLTAPLADSGIPLVLVDGELPAARCPPSRSTTSRAGTSRSRICWGSGGAASRSSAGRSRSARWPIAWPGRAVR